MPITTEPRRDALPGLELASPQATPAEAVGHDAALPHDDQPILSIRASVPEADASAFIAEALRDIRVFMQEHHLRAAGPPFAICRPHGADVDVEACWPTATRPAVGSSRIHPGALPLSVIGPRNDRCAVDALESHGSA